MNDATEYLSQLPSWPSFARKEESIDGLVPACKVASWKDFQSALNDAFFDRAGTELIFRGHRRHEWQLTPTLGRYTLSGVIQPKQAERQLDEFRYAMRGRGATFTTDDKEDELWAYGQHHGLATPLLDWTTSPFVALFFAFCDPDPEHEQPNPTRPIFVLNLTALEAMDEALIVQPMRSDHTRLINQAGLFTKSPLGEQTLITCILNLLGEAKVDLDDPAKVAEFICKIHIQCEPNERVACMRALKMMNIHHGTLFPDAIGASRYCNEWVGSQVAPARGKEAQPTLDSDEDDPRSRPNTQPFVISQLPTDLVQLLHAAKPPDVDLANGRAEEIASAITAIFEENAGPDWQTREKIKSSLRVGFRRHLLMRGWGMKYANSGAGLALQCFLQERTVKSDSADVGS